MSERKISFSSGEFYHVYNRGNSKQLIFHDANDFNRFMKLLYVSNGSVISRNLFSRKKEIFKTNRQKPLVAIGAYCLMSNHFHILLTEIEVGGISKFMQKLTTGYSMFYNNKYKRTGTLFEGKFRSEHVDEDRYLKYLFSYIHLNPVKLIDSHWKTQGIKNADAAKLFIASYRYSSYQDYLGTQRDESSIISSAQFPNYFSTSADIEKEIFEWIMFNRESLT